MSKTDSTTSKVLSFEDYFRAQPQAHRDVTAPELGAGRVMRVRGLTGAERDLWEASRMREKEPTKNGDGDESSGGYTQDFSRIRVLAVSLGTIDETGNPVFSTIDGYGCPLVSPANLEAVGRLPASLISRAYNAIVELSALTPSAQKALEGN